MNYSMYSDSIEPDSSPPAEQPRIVLQSLNELTPVTGKRPREGNFRADGHLSEEIDDMDEDEEEVLLSELEEDGHESDATLPPDEQNLLTQVTRYCLRAIPF